VIPGRRLSPALLSPVRGQADFLAMVAVIAGSKEVTRSSGLSRWRRLLSNTGTWSTRMRRGHAVRRGRRQCGGYGRVWWEQEEKARGATEHFGQLLPAWRGLACAGRCGYCEHRLREIAAATPLNGPRVYEAWAADTRPTGNRCWWKPAIRSCVTV